MRGRLTKVWKLFGPVGNCCLTGCNLGRKVESSANGGGVNIKMKKATIIALVIACAVLLGCQDAQLKKLAKAADGFAQTVAALQQAEITAHQQGWIDDAGHQAVQKAFLDVAHAGLELDQAIRVAKSKPQATVALGAAFDSLDRLLAAGTLHIKNPHAMESFQGLVLAAKGFVAIIAAAIG